MRRSALGDKPSRDLMVLVRIIPIQGIPMLIKHLLFHRGWGNISLGGFCWHDVILVLLCIQLAVHPGVKVKLRFIWDVLSEFRLARQGISSPILPAGYVMNIKVK